jgi:flagellin
MDALSTEINRIAGVTTWAGNSVMDGGGGASTTASPASKTFSLQVGAATGTKNQIAVAIKAMDASTLSVGKTSTISDVAFTTSSAVGADTAVAFKASAADTKTEVTIEGVKFTANAAAGTATVGAIATELANAINADTEMKARGITADTTTTANEVTLTFGAGTNTVVTSSSEAMAAVTTIDAAIKTVNTQRSELGAVSNRLSHTVSNMTNVSTNLSAARGGIEDADFAVETTNLAKNQILQQAATAMLAQANASKQNVLSLLQ